ncbi:hypothetical protein ACJIZ3_013216 [Penstemon smallii]|uniref:Dof zinc finger protein n=1 Tax=Penstemon smallii TaxID=265156 RepID=A0ABD3UP84_9LAMI
MDPSSSSISKSMGKTNNNNNNNNNDKNNNIPVAAADPAAVFKCPRCESTNTKFCYYNNYSLSQPRHFCKACKRYWTRGGTLRNVPVGGGCRKHKKRPPPNHGISTSTDPIQKQKQKQRERDLAASPTNNINNIPNPVPFLFTNNSMGLHFPFSTSGFGFGFGSGFSSSSSSTGLMDNNFYTTIQQGHNKYYSSTTTTTTTTTGLIKEFIDDEGAAAAANHTFPGSMLYDHKNSNMQINYEGTAKDDGVTTKILMDDDQEKYNINNHMMNHDHQHVLHTDTTSPPSSHLWNTTWYDPSSSSNYMGSSVPSLI